MDNNVTFSTESNFRNEKVRGISADNDDNIVILQNTVVNLYRVLEEK